MDDFDGIVDTKYQRQIARNLKKTGKLPENIRFSFTVPLEIARDFLRRFESKRLKVRATKRVVTQGDTIAQLMWLWGTSNGSIRLDEDIFNKLWPDHAYEVGKARPSKPRKIKNPAETRGRKPKNRQVSLFNAQGTSLDETTKNPTQGKEEASEKSEIDLA
jgi:hypothetical protein